MPYFFEFNKYIKLFVYRVFFKFRLTTKSTNNKHFDTYLKKIISCPKLFNTKMILPIEVARWILVKYKKKNKTMAKRNVHVTNMAIMVFLDGWSLSIFTIASISQPLPHKLFIHNYCVFFNLQSLILTLRVHITTRLFILLRNSNIFL